MAEKLTPQQHMAVTDRGGKLLVSAAAGSGKTKVLVDRLLSYLTDPNDPADLDEFLIITYTKAAAAELRSKIASKLVERISEDPGNRHLQQQMQRLYLTKISTVHSFCSDILREYAYRLDISGDFRVAEETECLELQLQAMEHILDAAYENASNDPDFIAFIDSQGFGRDDRQIPEIILKVYNSARCHLDPDKWLDWCLAANDVSGMQDAGETVWGKYLIEDLRKYLDMHIGALQQCILRAEKSDGMDKPVNLLRSIVDQLNSLRSSSRWDDIIHHSDIDYGRLVFPRKCSDGDLAGRIKAVRSACKKGLDKKLRRFADSSVQILADLQQSAAAARGLIRLTREFGAAYDKLKRSHRILDFGDLEHRTLDLLLGKSRSGPTAVALEVGQRFREVMVDEYQDSNAVQDAIFNALTQKRQNCFMVGDVKQSIYQFRLADPGIFLDKYNHFASAETAEEGQGRKVLLSSNFRSCGAVISAVNDVFSACMSNEIGGLVYGEEERLREGIPHAALPEPEIELYGVQVTEDTYAEEAAFTAERIRELLDGKHMVRQGDAFRPIAPDDIVILLRSPGSVGGEFVYALEQRGIRCSTGGGADLLQVEEVSTLRALLQIIRNPLQDIPLIAVLASPVFGFTADDLAAFRSKDRHSSVFEALRSSKTDKATHFLNILKLLREEARMSGLSQLLEYVFLHTKMDSIYAAMPDGAIKSENLRTFCSIASNFEAGGQRDLGHFLDYLNSLDERGLSISSDQSAAGAVTIMSIHKSKGLEFPVVFLCGLSREFNREDARAQVLCSRELGLGLACVDTKNRVRYPSIAKRAIAAKIISDSLSEEMRVLYVAMTRARDRLIMTYASKYLENDLADIVQRMDLSSSVLMTSDVDCPGKWILQTALRRTEAGEFFALSEYPERTDVSDNPWLIRVVQGNAELAAAAEDPWEEESIDSDLIAKIRGSLSFTYGHIPATLAPSKQTATQLKGRVKDQEAAEHAKEQKRAVRSWRKPSFIQESTGGTAYGNAIHAVMQYIRYSCCDGPQGVEQEIDRLVTQGYISAEQAKLADSNKIANFFLTELGEKLRTSDHVLREFKFSILDDGRRFIPDMYDERVLLQGVVDCALIEPDGITIIDFKTDRCTAKTVSSVIDRYRVQVETYAEALSRIYRMPVKSIQLYLFHLDRFAKIK